MNFTLNYPLVVLILIISRAGQIYGQENNSELIIVELNQLLDDYLISREYKGEVFEDRFEIDLDKSIIRIVKPIQSFDGDKFQKGRDQITIIQLLKLHPKSFNIKDLENVSLLQLFCRKNENCCSDNITSHARNRWSNGNQQSNYAAITIRKIKDKNAEVKLLCLFEKLIQSVNPNIDKNEMPPKYIID